MRKDDMIWFFYGYWIVKLRLLLINE